MTLLTQCREDEAVKDATPATLRTMYDVPVKRPFTAKQLRERDAAFLRAAVRAIAAKVREEADKLVGNTEVAPGELVGVIAAADFIERMGNE